MVNVLCASPAEIVAIWRSWARRFCSPTPNFLVVARYGATSYTHAAMAIIRENGRYRSCGDTAYLGGSALVLLFAIGCVSTDEPFFGGVDVPDLRPDRVG